jgi:hypothetical protein
MEHRCTLHTIFCWTSYFEIKIQNSNLNRMKFEYETVHFERNAHRVEDNTKMALKEIEEIV